MATKALPRKKAVSKRVINLEGALNAIQETLANLCECSHFDSDHLLNSKFKPINCAECACPRFKIAFKLERIDGKKR